MDGLDAVAGGPHVLGPGAHAVVDRDPAGGAEWDPGLAGEVDVGSYAEAEHDQVGGQPPPGHGMHGDCAAVRAGLDFGDRLGQHQGDAHGADRVGDETADVGVEHAHRGG